MAWITDKVVRCRYSFNVRGLKELRKSQFHNEGGILFLPNHPAEIDPIILYMMTRKKFRPRPLVTEGFYYLQGAHYFMKLVGAMPIPHIATIGNKWKMKKIDASLNEVISGLQKGENFIIYPSGQLKASGRETIGGNSFVHSLLERRPNTKIVLIRTTGLWGSIFSRAITGKSPDFWKVCLHGLKVFLRHGFLWTPKRKVTVEFEPAPADFPFRGTRLEINAYLEKWYNNYPTKSEHRVEEEPFTPVTYTRNREDFLKPFIRKNRPKKKRAIDLTEEDQQHIIAKIAEMAEVPPEEIHEDMQLSSDLGLDSLDVAQLHSYLDNKFDINDIEIEEVVTVYDVFEAAHGHSQSSKEEESAKKTGWEKFKGRKALLPPDGATIPEAFIRTCKRMGKADACADRTVPVLSYSRMLIAAIALAEEIKKVPGKYVGVLLPSTAGTYIIILAVLLAGKIPAMFNWTVGVRSLNHAKDILNVKAVISSRKFLNKVDSLDLGEVENVLVLAEDLRKKIKMPQKLSAAAVSKRTTKGILKHFGLKGASPDDPAVVLFTSGTESYPKAVPLSHSNILENQKAALSCVEFSAADIMYGILPPFHSFGFSVTGLLPILAGMRVFYSPDPTDARGMASDVLNWGVTIFCCAPTFYRNLFRVAARDQLHTVRLFVTGAEKAGEDLFNMVRSLGTGAEMVEGYGITECSPVVTLCRPGKNSAGVGEPLPGLELCLVKPETHEPVAPGEVGEVCVKGPSVFHGYLGHNAPNPFVVLGGDKWYLSGDLGRIDDNGNLILGGRLKRFVKIGGEMVSLVALEEELFKAAKACGWEPLHIEKPSLAVMPVEKGKDRPQLVLFCTFDAKKEDVNAALRASGFGRIVKIATVHQIDEIPLTGTSKVHYRKLEEMV